ncbi:MAG: RluA family pseudouridine synthase [Gammaproteobacteria bacterium]|jgi:23S rRNA pseudouridine955/2504/2580 synthase
MENSTPVRCISPQYVVVDAEYEGQRVDNFLIARLRGVPRTRIYRGLRQGEVRVNKGRIAPAYRLRIGDIVRIPPLHLQERLQAVVPSRQLVTRLSLSTVYEDEELLVLNKPSGWAVHGGSGERLGIIEAMRAMRPELHFLELVHRLDRDTSGCLLLAKKRSVLKQLHQSLRERKLGKRYLVLVRGRWRGSSRQVESGLRKRTLPSGERIVNCDAAGKASMTLFHPLAIDAQASLLQATPITGRTHQIRVQAALIGYPVAGDAKYGDRDFNQAMAKLGLRRLFLHALAVRLPGGATSRDRAVVAPMPDDLQAVLDRLEISHPLCGQPQP